MLLPYIAWSVLLTVVPTAGFVAFVRSTMRSLRYATASVAPAMQLLDWSTVIAGLTSSSHAITSTSVAVPAPALLVIPRAPHVIAAMASPWTARWWIERRFGCMTVLPS